MPRFATLRPNLSFWSFWLVDEGRYLGWLVSFEQKEGLLYIIILDSGFCIFALEIIMMKSLLKPNGNHVETIFFPKSNLKTKVGPGTALT